MRWVVGFLIGLMLVSSGLAIGIAPANTEVVFEPNKDQTLEFRVYNTEHKALTATITANGSLAEYLTIDTPRISFLETERSKTISVTIQSADTIPDDLAGDIIVESTTKVAAHIVMRKPAAMPTGNAVQEVPQEGAKDGLFTIVLIALIIGNVLFFTVAGIRKHRNKAPRIKNAKTVDDLIACLRAMDDTTFTTHVTEDKNEFADWLEQHKYPELAYQVYDLTDRAQMIVMLDRGMHQELPTDQASLKTEITELKHELDTFDFTEFEKVYK